jgi:predicted hydrocarbon binding protein
LEREVKSAEYARLNKEIENFYGRGGPGFLRRIGRASFQYGLREQSALMGLAGIALKVLPERQRIKLVLNNMMDALKKSNDQVEGWVEDEGDVISYTETTCASCVDRTSDKPVCHLYMGAIGEAVRWATGKEYEIIETHCLAMGHEFCRFTVSKPKKG